MRQRPSTPHTRYAVAKQPTVQDGYTQRIPMWEAVKRLGTANRHELFAELVASGYARPNGAELNVDYCRIELTDMTKRGFLVRIEG